MQLVRVAFGDQVCNGFDDRTHFFSRPRIGRGPHDIEGIHPFQILEHVALGERAPIDLLGLGTLNNFVIDIGKIHHVSHLVVPIFQITADHIEGEGAHSMTDVATGIHGHSADVHGDLTRLPGSKRFFLAAQGIINFQPHG